MSKHFVRNVASGLLAQSWTALLGLVVLPIYVRRLGPSSYGLLALCLTLVGVGSVMDLGIGRSLGKFIAAAGAGERDAVARRFFQVGITVALAVGVGACVVLLLTARECASYLFRVPAPLQGAAVGCVQVTAIAFPAMLVRMAIEGLLIGYERISIISLVAVLGNTTKAALGITAVLLNMPLPVVLAANVVAVYGALAVLLWYARTHLRKACCLALHWDRRVARSLLHLGGVSTACFLAGLGLLYLDRFLIAGFLAFVMVGYYSGCYDLASRQWTISINLCQSILPVFSEQAARRRHALAPTYELATRAIAAATSGIAATLAVLARPILHAWYGAGFAAHATPVLAWLSFGVLLNCYISLPYTLVFAGAPSPAIYLRIYGVGIALHAGLSLLLLQWYGMSGIAAAFCIAYGYVWLASLVWVRRHLIPEISVGHLIRRCFLPSWGVAAITAAFAWWVARPYIVSFATMLLGCGVCYALYLGVLAFTGFSRSERGWLWAMGLQAAGVGGGA